MAMLHACTLEDGCFIGMRSAVIDGAVVESRAMVAAGAMVTPFKRVRSGELWAGSPAKLMRRADAMRRSPDLPIRPSIIADWPRAISST